MIKKILVANRGEIAVRIIKACRELSISTVAVYSNVDKSALHVQLADEAVCIGNAPPLESYLNFDAIISAVKKTNADAVHPGYGFLAENHKFVERCQQEGIIFIGANPEPMRLLGNKVEARNTMKKAGIPITPGVEGTSADMNKLVSEAKKIGYPLLVKAAAGGGGKGMRIVNSEKDLTSSIEAGMREAKSAFGDETVYIEKYIDKPRHVEIQILADNHGNAVYLFERECSIQRRHQKIIEETPSPALTPELRAKMGQTAVNVVRASGYTNAGTVEFLLDNQGNFYFLEVNARIQVEHPITEMVTGVDLVKMQIHIANGGKLPFTQRDLSQRGHAIECRIYGEDADNNFFPSFGKILFLHEPTGPGIRCDSGIYSGYEVQRFYDPILSKLIVWAENRESAIKKMTSALSDYVIMGIKTPIPYLIDLLNHPEFIAGRTHTGFIPQYMSNWKEENREKKFIKEALIAGAIAEFNKTSKRTTTTTSQHRIPSPWETIGKWEIGSGSEF